MFLIKFFGLLLLFSGTLAETYERPRVKISQGELLGYPRQSQNGRIFSAYEGIPFAKPPVGHLRFEPPQPSAPWPGTWDASIVHDCLQTEMLRLTAISGDEDCLYLNVYTPQTAAGALERPLPVVVHFHGGAFMYGAAHSYASPDLLLDRDVLLVTPNYRLGVFGFLAAGDAALPGNAGLKDQVLALRWVREHIAAFGGDPRAVTLHGLAAGGAAAHFHQLSPLSSGLFARAVSSSGVATNPWALQERPRERFDFLAEVAGCGGGGLAAAVECLRWRPFKHLLTKMQFFYAVSMLPMAPFAPVVEPEAEGAFLTKNPYYLTKRGPINDVPWLVSNVAHEGLFPVTFLMKHLGSVNYQWKQIAPYLFDYNYTLATSVWNSTADAIRNEYIGENTQITLENVNDLIRISSDRYFLIDSVEAAKVQAKSAKSPVYYYNFGYVDEKSINKTVAHGDDAAYIFKGVMNKKLTEKDMKMSKVALDILTSFAATGTPTVEGVEWPATGHKELTFLNITESGELKIDTKKELGPTEFWYKLGLLENQNLMLLNEKDEL